MRVASPWLVVASVALLLPVFSYAQVATLACTPPTLNVDGSPISGPLTYKFYRGSTAASQTIASTAQTTCAYAFTGLPFGTHYFSAAAIAGGLESARSNVVSKLVAGLPPNPPTIPQPVSIAGPVFNLAITDDSLVWLQSGTVVAGQPCDPTQQIAYGGVSYMRINASLVTPLPGQQILTAWGQCQ